MRITRSYATYIRNIILYLKKREKITFGHPVHHIKQSVIKNKRNIPNK